MKPIPLPSKVYIGPYVYTVIKRDKEWYEDSEAYGSTWVDRKIINVVTVGIEEVRQLDTFLHECLHAVWDCFHIDKKVEEEEAVSKMSTGMLLLLRQNPEILDLLYNIMGE